MKRFLRLFFMYLGVGMFLSLILFLFASYSIRTFKKEDSTAVIIDKYNNILKADRNRIILMGGSNVLYSVDSELIEKSIQRKVLNSSFVFNMGYEYQLNFLKKFTKKGDLILYFPEFACYSGIGKYGTDLLYKSILYEKRLLNVIGFENFKSYLISSTRFNIKSIIESLETDNKLLNTTQSKFNRYNGFNKNGDLISHLDNKPQLDKIRSYPVVESLSISNDFINELKILKKELENKGAKLLVMFPIYSKNFVSQKLIKEIDSLTNTYDYFKGNLEEILFDDEMFYDSPYHALRKARNLRTHAIINNINN